MVVYYSLTVMACGDVTMVTGSIPFWVPVRPSVKRATPYSKNALRYRTTVKSQVGTVFRVHQLFKNALNTLKSHSVVLYGEVQDQLQLIVFNNLIKLSRFILLFALLLVFFF